MTLPQALAVELNKPGGHNRHNNSKPIKRDYVVTVTQEHFFAITAETPEEASRLALADAKNRWGHGRNPTVTEVAEIER